MELLIAPGGRAVEFSLGQSVLDALLTGGIPFSYSCMAGRCGTCRYRLIDGEIVERTADGQVSAVLPGAYALACRGLPGTDCSIEIAEPDEIVCHPARSIKGVVVGNESLTPDIQRLRVRLAKPLEFTPGQYANLQFAEGYVRPYSMANISHDELEFHVRVVQEGRVSSYLRKTVREGDVVRVTGPLGAAYLRQRHEGPILCVAGGTGLAPVLAILRGLVAAGMRNPVRVFFAARTADDLYGIDWLRELQASLPDMQVELVVKDSTANGLRAGLVTDAISHDLPSLMELAGLDTWKTYLCGSPGMVEAITKLLVDRGIDERHIHADAFYTVAESNVHPSVAQGARM